MNEPALSVILITHNEAGNIAACLGSVSFADEWIVVDSGSTDATCEIARGLGGRTIQCQIMQADIEQERQPIADLLLGRSRLAS